MASRQEIINYITQSAQRRGIDPRVALRVFHGESGFNPRAKLVTPREASYGVTQLNIKGGLGVDALKRGIDPRDPNQWQQTIDFSLDHVRRGGWTPWAAAKKAGVARWTGVNTTSDTARTKTPSLKGGAIDIGDKPTLQNLTPPKSTRPPNPADRAETQILRQLAPTETPNMARPSMSDAIRKSMDEAGIRDRIMTAGFVPPGLTKGSAKTRAAANKNVVPPGAMPVERDIGADVGPYNRNAPGTRGMEGSYADYVRQQHAEMAKRQSGGAQLPPGVKSATDSSGAVDPRAGTAVAPYDPNLAAQNDPARQALIAARIRGSARQGGQPPPQVGGPTATPPGGSVPNLPKAAAAGAAVAAGVSAAQQDEDPAVAAVKQQINGPGATNVDPSVAAYEKQLGVRSGSLRDPNTGAQQMAMPIIQKGFPAFQDAMKDPQTRQAAQKVAQSVISAAARREAQQADMRNDPTFYQQQAARSQMQPGGGGGGGDPISDRAMERAVMMDNARRAPSARGMPQQQQRPVPPQPVPSRGNVSARPTLPEEKGDVPPSTEQQIVNQAIPPPTPVRTQSVPPAPGAASANPYPEAPLPPVGSADPTGGVQGVRPSGQMPMDPVMMQLMQFFTGGGGMGGQVP